MYNIGGYGVMFIALFFIYYYDRSTNHQVIKEMAFNRLDCRGGCSGRSRNGIKICFIALFSNTLRISIVFHSFVRSKNKPSNAEVRLVTI